jgi:hypothetical protein
VHDPAASGELARERGVLAPRYSTLAAAICQAFIRLPELALTLLCETAALGAYQRKRR